MPRLVQITDTHIHDDPEWRIRGVDARGSLSAVLADVRARHGDADRFVLTGDLAHDALEPAHRYLREQFEDLLPRCLLIPGNHDDRGWLRRIFADRISQDHRRLVFSERVGRWRLIGLDSLSPCEVAGMLGEQQRIWLESQLEQHREEPTVLFVHHPPMPIGSDWLDEIGLADGDALQELAARMPQVRLVCAGHVHQEFAGRMGQAVMLTAPSTCAQFARDQRDENDDVPPGYRVIELTDDGFDSHVVRVPWDNP